MNVKGFKTVNVKASEHDKTQYTAVLSCFGERAKLPPLLIFKKKTLPNDKILRGIAVHVHQKDLMDNEGMKFWIDKVWLKCSSAFLKNSFLVRDQFRANKTNVIKERVQKKENESGSDSWGFN